MMPQYIIIHYNEIALKGKNRFIFENHLKENLQKSLAGQGIESVKKISGRLLIKPNEKSSLTEIQDRLKKVFGIAYFCPSFVKTGLKNITDISLAESFLKELGENIWTEIQHKNFTSFKISCKRSEKIFPLTSQEINKRLGAIFCEKTKAKVNLEHPELIIFIEIVGDLAFFYFDKIKGPGGLPTGSSGKVISLISSGIDSPVASYELMKRGSQIIFVHFHSYPATSLLSQENVKKILKILSSYQPNLKLYLVPFLEIQKEITKNLPLNLGVIFYRRIMIKIAQKIAQIEKAKALVTGDSLGQVASQTLENILVINDAADIPVFRPLIGRDKEEIIDLAKKIGTFELSIMPYEDCCSLFVPSHPETKANLAAIKKLEEKFDFKTLIQKVLQETKVEIINKK